MAPRCGDPGGSSNGRTADSDSACLGSNPSPPATAFARISKDIIAAMVQRLAQSVSHLLIAISAGSLALLSVLRPQELTVQLDQHPDADRG
jgi:hypothetical protein